MASYAGNAPRSKDCTWICPRKLRKFNGNQTQAARYLGLSRKTPIYRMEEYNLQRDAEAGAGPNPDGS